MSEMSTRTVYKYTIPITDAYDVEVKGVFPAVVSARVNPVNRRELDVYVELFATEDETTTITIHTEGTGHAIMHSGEYVITVFDDPLVWHIYVTEGVQNW